MEIMTSSRGRIPHLNYNAGKVSKLLSFNLGSHELVQNEIGSIRPGMTGNSWLNYICTNFLFFRSRCTSDNFDQLASNDSLTRSVEENLVLGDHISSILGSVLKSLSACSNFTRVFLRTSIALRRADCSQACPSASAQKRALDKAYSRRLARTSSSISKAAKLAVDGCQNLCSTSARENLREAAIASSEKASIGVAS